jgi:hypothetical protein
MQCMEFFEPSPQFNGTLMGLSASRVKIYGYTSRQSLSSEYVDIKVLKGDRQKYLKRCNKITAPP